MELPLILVLVIACVVFLVIMSLWIGVEILRTRRAFRLAIRNHEEAMRARKAGPDAEGVVWDRELDG